MIHPSHSPPHFPPRFPHSPRGGRGRKAVLLTLGPKPDSPLSCSVRLGLSDCEIARSTFISGSTLTPGSVLTPSLASFLTAARYDEEAPALTALTALAALAVYFFVRFEYGVSADGRSITRTRKI